MAGKENTVKGKGGTTEPKGGSGKKAAPAKKSPSPGIGAYLSNFMGFARSERGRKTFALLLILCAAILFLALISHFFTGNKDQSLVLSEGMLLPTEAEKPANWLGSFGAFFGHLFITRGFGVMAILLPLYLALIGVAMLERKYFALVWKLLKYVLFSVIWGSTFFAFVSLLAAGKSGNLGGGFGWYINDTLGRMIGMIGVGLVIVVSLLIFLVVNYNTNLPLGGVLAKLGAMLGMKVAEEAKSAQDTGAAKEEKTAEKQATDEDEEDEGDVTDDSFIISVRKEDKVETPVAEKEVPVTPTPKESETPILSIPSVEDDPLLKTINPSLDLPLTVTTPVTGEVKKEGGLEFVIEETKVDEEIDLGRNPVIAVETGDNIFEVEDDRFEKIVPDEDQEVLDDEEVVGDWEDYDPTKDLSDYQYPPIDLLQAYDSQNNREVNRSELEENKNKIVTTLNHYKIEITSIKATIGPTVTLYEIVPAPGIRISKIKNLEDDIALSLAALGIRIIAPIPGKGTIGIEIPNSNPEIVSMRSVLATERFRDTKAELPIAIGRTISNEVFIADLAKMPHLLVAGATGQGKSVGINGLISSILFKKHPSQVKFVLIDPKKVELSLYTALENHFLARLESQDEPIITDTKQVIHVLNSLCAEMDTRYDLLKKAKVRNLREYNEKFISRRLNPRKGHRFMPYIVLIIDEFADLMMTAGKEIETPIARLAQLARAIGIHLVLATQRPSVNVITGIIKANFPARISYRVTSKVDSRTILDTGGADQLIGRGDLLLSTGSDIVRIQNAFIDTPEVDKLVDFISGQRGYPEPYYLPEVSVDPEMDDEDGPLDIGERDDMFEDAARLIVQHQQGSTSLIQRRLKLGYNRAGRIIDQLEHAGIVGPFSGSKARDVLVKDEYTLEQILSSLD